MLVNFHGLNFDLPDGWLDVTADLQSEVPTLACAQGVGVIQFSTAFYSGGEQPVIDYRRLKEINLQFCAKNFQSYTFIDDFEGRLLAVKSFSTGSDGFTAVWHLTNGLDIVLVTYPCDTWSEQIQAEVEMADEIVRSLSL